MELGARKFLFWSDFRLGWRVLSPVRLVTGLAIFFLLTAIYAATVFANTASPIPSTGLLSHSPQRMQVSGPATQTITAKELVFIDSAVADQSVLIDALQRNAELVLLPENEDGIAFIAKTLQQYSNLGAIHIVSHGDSGQLRLGQTELNSETLSRYVAEINTIRNALSSNADILLYGCNVSSGAQGEKFISAFAAMAGADLAASSNVTGDFTQGGDWVLESRLGDVQTAMIFNDHEIKSYKGLLAVGVASISGAAEQGQLLTAGISDADGTTTSTFSYQWNRGGAAIIGATAASYTLVQADVGSTISVTISYIDDLLNNEIVTSAATGVVANVNDLPGGSVTISGLATEGQILSAQTGTISDADGVGAFSFQWNRGGTGIAGATGSSYLLVQADVGSAITVTVSYIDGGGFSESLTSAPTTAVLNVNNPPVGTVTISGAATEGQVLTAQTGTISDADNNGGAISFSYQWNRSGIAIVGANSSTYLLVQTDVGNTMTVTVSYTDAGSMFESLTSAPTTAVLNVNEAPVITSTSITTATEHVFYSYTINATDSDSGDVLSYSAPSKPNWLNFNAASRTLSGTPGDTNVGSFAVTLRVFDGTVNVDQSFTVTVANINDAPVITSVAKTAVNQNALYSYTITASDVDGDSLIYSAPVKPNWLNFNAATRKLTGTPSNANVGSFNVVLRVADGVVTVDQNFTVTVANVNDAPVVASVAVTAATENVAYSYTIIASDVDGDSLTFSAPVRPDWLSFNPVTRTLSGTPGSANIGTFAVTLRVFDGTVSVDQNFTVTVMNINDIPVISSIAVTTATEHVFYSYTINASDADSGDTLRYSAPVKPNWLNFNAVSRRLSGTPGDTNVGVFSVTLRVYDGTVNVDQSFTVTVANVNDAPVITSVARKSVNQNSLYSYTILASDVDGDNLSYSSPVKPGWLSFNASTRKLTGTPANSDVGRHNVVLRVTDGQVNVDQSFNITVANVNDAPVISSIAITLAKEHDPYTYTIVASDVDGDRLTYSAPKKPGWLRFDKNSHTLSGTPGDANVGVFNVRLRVSDGKKNVEQKFTITVENVNDPVVGLPVINGIAEQKQLLTADTSAISDADGLSDFSYQWSRGVDLISRVAIPGATGRKYRLVQADVGSILTVKVSYIDDGATLESVTSVPTVEVLNVNDLPVGKPIINGIAVQNETLTVDTSAIADEDGPVPFPDPLLEPDFFRYQWLRDGEVIDDVEVFDEAGVFIGYVAATASSYTLMQADVDREISVVVSYTDLTLVPESIVSDVTDPVVNVNDSGIVTIVGSATDGSLLTVSIEDPDGIEDSDFIYQWLRGATAESLLPVPGETGENYKIVFTDIGQFIGVVVTYTDDQDTDEVISAVIGAIRPDVPNVTAPPVLGPINATGWFTFVSLDPNSVASAFDTLDNSTLPATPDSTGRLRPGINTITWSATDSAGNVGTAEQIVQVIPMVEVSKLQRSAEGSSASFTISLNGDAVQYPVSVPYSVTGSADGGDHSLVSAVATIEAPAKPGELPKVNIPFTVVNDGFTEGIETIVITLSVPVNAILGQSIVHTVEIVEGNVPPLVRLEVSQRQMDVESGLVTASVIASDVNDGDSLSYDWSRTDNAVPKVNIARGEKLSFDANVLTPGYYTLHIAVDDGIETRNSSMVFSVVSSLPALDSELDSDGDDIDDKAEGFADEDSDGIADYLDAITAAHVMQIKPRVSDAFIMQTEPGLKLSLGDVAFKTGLGGSLVVQEDLTNYSFVVGAEGEDISIDSINNVGGYVDFIVTGLRIAGQSVQVVIPQLAPMPRSSVYRKLAPLIMSGPSTWQDFVQDANNTVASAAGEEGYCPPPGDPLYIPGLSEGHWCLQLTIEDGGPNDSDGVANNQVVDPGGVGRVLTSVNVSSSGSSGVLHPLVFVLSVFIILLLRSKNCLLKKVVWH